MASCETLEPLPATYALYAGSLPYGLVWAGIERFPNLLRMSVPAVPPSVPRWTDRVRLAVPSSIALAFAFSAEARHPHAHARRFSRGLRNEAAKFTSCYGPAGLLALHRQGRLRPRFRPPGRPGRASGITMRAHSQFPQPDLHRLDMRPYGLHAKSAEIAKNCQVSPSRRSLRTDRAHLRGLPGECWAVRFSSQEVWARRLWASEAPPRRPGRILRESKKCRNFFCLSAKKVAHPDANIQAE